MEEQTRRVAVSLKKEWLGEWRDWRYAVGLENSNSAHSVLEAWISIVLVSTDLRATPPPFCHF